MNTLESIYRLISEHRYTEALSVALAQTSLAPADTNLIRIISFCRVKLGLFDEAIEALELAIKQGRKNNEIFISLAYAYASLGNVTSAQTCINQSIDYQKLTKTSYGELVNFMLSFDIDKPTVKYFLNAPLDFEFSVSMLKQKISVAKHYGLYSFVLLYCDTLLSQNTAPNIQIDKAIALRYMNRPKEALKILKSLATQISHYAIHHNLGNVYSDLGDYDKAAAAYNSAIKLNESYIDSHVNLARILWEMGKTDVYLQSFSSLLLTSSYAEGAVLAYVNLLLEGELYSEAESFILERIKHSKSELLCLLLCKCLRLNKRPEEAQQILNSNDKLITENPAVKMEKLEIALALGNIDVAKGLVSDLISIREYRQIARANQYVIERLSNVTTVLKEYIGEFELPINAVQLTRIQDELITMHNSVHQPINQTVKSGKQTRGNLFPARTENLKQVEKQILSSVNHYVASNKTTLFPHLANNAVPEFAGSWSILIKDAGGFHTSHYHSKAEVSGVFYVKLPTRKSNEENAACLHFGQVDKAPFVALSSELVIAPKEGSLILFPSHVWHGTVPTVSNEERLTIAFDIVY